MEESRRSSFWRLMCSFHLYLCLAAVAVAAAPHFFIHCDAIISRDVSSMGSSPPQNPTNPDENLNGLMKMILDMVRPLQDDINDSPSSYSNSEPYGTVSSPFTLPPYDSLSPIPLPQNPPPFCIYPPFISQPSGATTTPPPASFSPSFPFPNPNPNLSPPQYVPTPMPPAIEVPSPPQYVPSPSIYVPSPPQYVPGPPFSVPISPPSGSGGGGGGGIGYEPSPPVFLPPIVYPPPAVPPPPYTGPTQEMWCVAKPSVPGPIIQEALNYACASGAECDEIQSGGSCFQPNTLVAHASYAFNSYWQRTKVAGGTCGFGGIAILVTVDPSFDGCHFIYF